MREQVFKGTDDHDYQSAARSCLLMWWAWWACFVLHSTRWTGIQLSERRISIVDNRESCGRADSWRMGRRKSNYMQAVEYFWIKEYLRLNPIKHPVNMDAFLSQLRCRYKDNEHPEFKKWYIQLRTRKLGLETRLERQRRFDAFRTSRCFKSRLLRLRRFDRAQARAKGKLEKHMRSSEKGWKSGKGIEKAGSWMNSMSSMLWEVIKCLKFGFISRVE